MTLTDEVRSFNRFYTREIGLLNRSLPATDLSLPEARVLYELAQAPEGGRTAAEIGRTLSMDKAHLSRIVARFVARGLAASRVSPDHRKHRLLALTDAGRKVFAAAEAGARAQVDALIEPVDAGGRNRLVEAMRDIRAALRDREAAGGELILRPLRPGDVGWIIHRQAVLYAEEYGWDWTYEGLASRILGAFVAEFDAVPRRCLGRRARRRNRRLDFPDEKRRSRSRQAHGCSMSSQAPAGPASGARLVAACIARARELGYRQLTLWTNDILVAARRIYQAAGFQPRQTKRRTIPSAMTSSARPGRSI